MSVSENSYTRAFEKDGKNETTKTKTRLKTFSETSHLILATNSGNELSSTFAKCPVIIICSVLT
jgi:hypothetical protein